MNEDDFELNFGSLSFTTGTKKVSFDEVVRINEWDDSDENRKGFEEIDRMRFQNRIEEVNNKIGWVFGKVHRR